MSLDTQPSPSWPLSQIGEMELSDLPLDFIESMAKLADKIGQRMSQTNEKRNWRVVRETIDNAEITFGVWRDPAQPRGIGLMCVRGANRLRQIIATGVMASAHIAAIPCFAEEQALALRQKVGDQTH